ncbi:MAG: DNA polymerase II [Candidatus Methanomethylophilaceae archaeon]|nr:DNA polymerase II [Candidatus Methanomethylophilaceae archaeon]
MGEWDVRLLSASYRQDGDDVAIELFGKTREQKSITILYYGFHTYFHILNPRKDLAESLRKDDNIISVEEDRLLYKGDMNDVLKVTIKYPWLMNDFRNRLKGAYRLLSADINFADRFLYDLDMGSCIHVTGEEIEKDYSTDLTIKMESFENIDSFDPGLKFLSFDIENSVLHGYLLTICSVVYENGEYRNCEAATGSEKDIIKKFSEIIQKEDPDVITGYNIDNYDITKIMERARLQKIESEVRWGRDGGIPKRISERFWRAKGRLVVDAWWAVRRELRPKQETLNAVSMQILGETKLDVDPKYMDEEWAKNSAKVIEYCFKDAELALKILQHVGTVRKGMDLAAVSYLPVEDILTSGTSTLADSLLIRKADREKIGVPMTGKMSRTDQIEGGYVHTMNPGLYHWVCVLDFKSMYPSLIIAKNICFTTLSPDGEIVSPDGTTRYVSKERREGLLPRILEGLMKQRDDIKARMKKTSNQDEYHYLDGLQAAVKVLMNTFYGVFASSFYRFTDKSIGASITAFARATTIGIIKEVEAEGVPVIYSDTDSIFMQSPEPNLEGSIEFGNRMAERFSRDGGTLEFEKIFEPMFTHGMKKRYVGRIVYPEPQDELLVRGYEIRRSDSFDLQSDVLMKLFNYILEERNDEALTLVKTTVQDVLAGKVPASELVISKGCKGLDAYENPDRMANVQAAKKLIDMGYEFIPGMKVSWIVTDSNSTPQKVEPYISGVEFKAKPDYRYYAERIAQTASRITEVFGWNEKDIMMGSQQATLFDGKFDRPRTAKKKVVPKEEPPAQPKVKNTKLSDFF